MLNFCSLYSGSTGNCLFVKSNNTNLLIDAGVSLKKIEQSLEYLEINPYKISGILITHEHSDHIKSIGNISKKYNIPIFTNLETWNAIGEDQKQKVSPNNVNYFSIDKKFIIGDIEILPFSIPHDAANPCGFNLYNNSSKISIATDLGHITPEILKNLENILCGNLENLPQDIQDKYLPKLRCIPFSSLEKENGMLVGIKISEIVVKSEDEEKKTPNIIIGIYGRSLTKNGEYRALVGVDLL